MIKLILNVLNGIRFLIAAGICIVFFWALYWFLCMLSNTCYYANIGII